MTRSEFLKTLDRRASTVGLVIPHELAEHLADYFALLARWNLKVNLTGFPLDSPTDAAIDRLFIEPLLVATFLDPNAKAMIDIGSGGGSPGIPIALSLSPDRTVLVEAKTKKGFFLKEVVRNLGLSQKIEIRNARFEDLAASNDLLEGFDVVTVRAVRVDEKNLSTLATFLKSRGQAILFWTGNELSLPRVAGVTLGRFVPLATKAGNFAAVMEKT